MAELFLGETYIYKKDSRGRYVYSAAERQEMAKRAIEENEKNKALNTSAERGENE